MFQNLKECLCPLKVQKCSAINKIIEPVFLPNLNNMYLLAGVCKFIKYRI